MTSATVEWTLTGERDLLALAPSEAERLLDAVDEFALTGRGFVRIMLDGSEQQRLYFDGFYVVFDFDGARVRVYRVVRR